MSLRTNGRRIISVTMQPHLHEELCATCRRLDVPLTVWVREAIKVQLESQKPYPCAEVPDD